MHSNSLLSFRVAFGKRNEIPNNTIFWTGSIRKLHLMDFNLVALEVLRVVELIVESDNTFDVQVFKWVN